MREIFLLYGSPGQWERLQAEIASARKERKAQIAAIEEAKKRTRNLIVITVVCIGTTIIGFYYFQFLFKLMK